MRYSEAYSSGTQVELAPVLDTAPDVLSPLAPAVDHGDEALLDSYSRTVTRVVEKVRGAVVNIRVSHQARGQSAVMTPAAAAGVCHSAGWLHFDEQPRGP